LRRTSREANAAGLSGGTGFAGIAVLLPDGIWKSILLLIAPTITVVISSSWDLLSNEANTRVADWKIRTQKRRAQALLEVLKKDPNATDEIKQKAQDDVNALSLLELEISRKRVQAIVTP
jgi:hypothetical protein